VVLAIYLIALALLVVSSRPIDYDAWAGIFAPLGMKIATLIAFVALAYHAWIGMRDVWMDYVRSTAVRMVLQLATILWLAACLAWAVQILWRV
jgi:succinate dehydrogenase / fumarate reductase membrane anchor subunit